MKLYEEFKEYETLWEDWSTRYNKGNYEAAINNDSFEDPSFEDEFLPMDYDILKDGRVIETVRGLKNAKIRIDELIEEDIEAIKNKYVIGLDLQGFTFIENSMDPKTVADIFHTDSENGGDGYGAWDEVGTYDISSAKLFNSYDEAFDFLSDVDDLGAGYLMIANAQFDDIIYAVKDVLNTSSYKYYNLK